MPLNKSYFSGSLFADNVIKNPFIISLLITVLALIIFYAINSSKMIDQNIQDKIKSGFWLLIAITILTSVHFFAVKKYLSFNSVTQNLQDNVHMISSASDSTDVYEDSIKKEQPVRESIQSNSNMSDNVNESVRRVTTNMPSAFGSGETLNQVKSCGSSDNIIKNLPSTIS